MIIYKVTNKYNGMSYIGQTVYNLERRKSCHFAEKCGTYFNNALRKYGRNTFEWEVLEECSSREELNKRETYYIEKFNTFKPNGYNLTKGGSTGTYGWIPTEENRKNMRKAQLGNKRSKESCRKQSERVSGEGNPMYGRKRYDMMGNKNPAKRPEVRKKISEAKKGRKRPDLSERNKRNKGKTFEEIYGPEKAAEIREKMRAARLKR